MTRLVPAPDGLAAAGSGADDLAGALARLQQARGRGEQLVHVTVEGRAGDLGPRVARLRQDLLQLGHRTADAAVVDDVAVLTVQPADTRPARWPL